MFDIIDARCNHEVQHRIQFKIKCIYIPETGTFSSNLLSDTSENVNALELHLSRLIRMTSQPDKQKIQINGFFFENMLP